MRIEDMKGALPHRKEKKTPEPPKELTTVWGEKPCPEHVREEYPRPRLARENYSCLNGLWNCEFTKEPDRPARFSQRILVPFSPESALSGVRRQLQPDEYLWYERQVPMPARAAGEHILLHFEAADQIAVVFIDGKEVLRHTGGYLPFTADITEFFDGDPRGEFTLTVRIQDFSDTSFHSRGKQKLVPGGMYYTAQSGLWGSVWMETVPARYLTDVLFETQPDLVSVRVRLITNEAKTPGGHPRGSAGSGRPEGAASVLTKNSSTQKDAAFPRASSVEKTGDDTSSTSESGRIRIFAPTVTFDSSDEWYRSAPILEEEASATDFLLQIPQPRLWSPDTPWLYPVEVRWGQDRMRSYLALRTFGLERDARGIQRILLNGNPVFLNGLLDQGYWPDGLCTAPADEAFVYDITQMKALGFNMLRKHAKLESRRWYYHCDRLGMIVWQDMVNGGGNYSALLLTYLPTGLCVPGPRMRRERSGRTQSPAAGDGELPARSALPRETDFPKDDDPERHGQSDPRMRRGENRAPRRASLAERFEYRITSRTDPEGREEFRRECAETVKLLKGHPCIMTWVIFNEGWGQFETRAMTNLVRSMDPGRLIDSASGWFEHKTGDFKSVHNYFRTLKVPKDLRANVLSEYGGYVYHVDEHSMFETTYGYHTCGSQEEFEQSFLQLMTQQVLPLREKGLCGAVYTQVSDIEEETNGLLTYDRKICKISEQGAARLREAAGACQASGFPIV